MYFLMMWTGTGGAALAIGAIWLMLQLSKGNGAAINAAAGQAQEVVARLISHTPCVPV
jgi:TM2 domain-containing membrane protein YozV